MDTMATVSQVLNHLKSEGYTIDFNLQDNCLVCHNNELKLHPEDFVLDKHFRFEGMSDPGDEAVVYAISSIKYQIKGTLVNGYGIYSDEATDEILKKLHEKVLSSTAEAAPNSNEVKFNAATPLRPEGARKLDAPMVEMDLNVFLKQIKEEKAWKTSDRNAITIFKSNGLRMVLIGLHQGAEMKSHTAAGMISVQVLEGQITFRTGSETSERSKGQMIALHTGIPHSVYANQESVFLLTLTTTLPEK